MLFIPSFNALSGFVLFMFCVVIKTLLLSVWDLDSCPVSSAVTMCHHGKKIRLSKEYCCTIYIEELFLLYCAFRSVRVRYLKEMVQMFPLQSPSVLHR